MPPGIGYKVPESAGIGFPPLDGSVFSFCYVSFRKKNALWGVASLFEVETGSFSESVGLETGFVHCRSGSQSMGAAHLSLFPC